jgi:hypothetical protein
MGGAACAAAASDSAPTVGYQWRMARRSAARRDPLTEELAELSALPPASFVARRDALAKQLRADGDRDLAARVAHLRRPSITTWAVNAAARSAPDIVAELVDAVRTLQRSGDVDVRAATGRLDDALDALVDHASTALGTIDTKPTADRRAEVRTALRIAALADDATPLLEARLQDADALDSDATLEAALRSGASARGRRARSSSSAAGGASDDTASAKAKAAARRQELEAALEAARSERDDARDAVTDAERVLERSRRALQRAEDAVEKRQADLDRARRR